MADKDAEKRARIAEINKRLNEIDEKLAKIPDEIERLDSARKNKRVKMLDYTKKIQEQLEAATNKSTQAKLATKSAEYIDKENQELCGITRNKDELSREQTTLSVEKAKLEQEKADLLKS